MANRVPKGYFRGQATRPSNVRVPLAVTAIGDELYAVTVPRNSRDVASNFSYANAASGTSKKLVNSKTKATIVLWSYQKLDDLECGLAPEQWPKRNCGFPWTTSQPQRGGRLKRCRRFAAKSIHSQLPRGGDVQTTAFP